MSRNDSLVMVARIVHEAMRAYQAQLGEAEDPPWHESGWMQQASIEAVEAALRNPDASAQHEAWIAMKERDGWKYGPNRDDARKIHPSLVPFERLPVSEQMRDVLLVSIVQSLARALALAP